MDIESFKRHPVYGVLQSAVTDSNLKLNLAIGEHQIELGDGTRQLDITVPKGSNIPTSMSEFALGKAYVEGEFDIGDSVRCVDTADTIVAVGLTNFNSSDLNKIKGLHSDKIESILGYKESDEVMHRDNLVLS